MSNLYIDGKYQHFILLSQEEYGATYVTVFKPAILGSLDKPRKQGEMIFANQPPPQTPCFYYGSIFDKQTCLLLLSAIFFPKQMVSNIR